MPADRKPRVHPTTGTSSFNDSKPTVNASIPPAVAR